MKRLRWDSIAERLSKAARMQLLYVLLNSGLMQQESLSYVASAQELFRTGFSAPASSIKHRHYIVVDGVG